MDIHTQVMEKVIKYKQSFGLQNIMYSFFNSVSLVIVSVQPWPHIVLLI